MGLYQWEKCHANGSGFKEVISARDMA